METTPKWWQEIISRTAYNEETGKFEVLREDFYTLKKKLFEQSPQGQASLFEKDSGEGAKPNLCDTCSKKDNCKYMGKVRPTSHCTAYEVSEPEPLGRSEEVERSEGS